MNKIEKIQEDSKLGQTVYALSLKHLCNEMHQEMLRLLRDKGINAEAKLTALRLMFGAEQALEKQYISAHSNALE